MWYSHLLLSFLILFDGCNHAVAFTLVGKTIPHVALPHVALSADRIRVGAAAVTSAVEFLAVLHAQRHSRRIEYTTQVAGHGHHSWDTHNLFGLLLSLLLSGLSWTTCDMCGRGHGIARPGGFLSRKGGDNSSSTGIPTTTCS